MDSLGGIGMDNAATGGTALDETVVFLRYFEDLPDPRRPGKVTDPLDELLLLCLVAAWVAARTGLPEGVIAIDGRTLRRSRDK
jgi:hypothetical protein